MSVDGGLSRTQSEDGAPGCPSPPVPNYFSRVVVLGALPASVDEEVLCDQDRGHRSAAVTRLARPGPAWLPASRPGARERDPLTPFRACFRGALSPSQGRWEDPPVSRWQLSIGASRWPLELWPRWEAMVGGRGSLWSRGNTARGPEPSGVRVSRVCSVQTARRLLGTEGEGVAGPKAELLPFSRNWPECTPDPLWQGS